MTAMGMGMVDKGDGDGHTRMWRLLVKEMVMVTVNVISRF